MKNNLKILLRRLDGQATMSDKFQHSTENNSLDSANFNILKEWTQIHFKTYPRLNRIFLKRRQLSSKLAGFLRSRRSVRSYSRYAINTEQLSYLLFGAFGLIRVGSSIDQSRRPYPSAGARYPIEVYVIVNKCKDLPCGLYHYNVIENSLEVLQLNDLANKILASTGNESWIKDSPVVVILTGILGRVSIKYGDRGYRYMLIETGCMAQNISILSKEIGFGSCLIGGYIDSQISQLLDIDEQKEYPLCLITIGKK